MATTEAEICNIALGAIGAKSLITALDPNEGVEARHCTLFYEVTRNALLRSHDWQFARRTVALALTSEDLPPEWDYGYQYPNKCMRIHRVRSAADRITPQKYQLGANEALNKKLIYTDQEDAYIVYTAVIENTTLFDYSFVNCLAFAMAIKLAMPLTKKPGIQKAMQDAYLSAWSMAIANDANEQHQGDQDALYVSEATAARQSG